MQSLRPHLLLQDLPCNKIPRWSMFLGKPWFRASLVCWEGFPGSSVAKESACNPGDSGLISGSRRSPGGENGNPLQYSCLENSMTEEPGGLQSMGLQRVGYDWACMPWERIRGPERENLGSSNFSVRQGLCSQKFCELACGAVCECDLKG